MTQGQLAIAFFVLAFLLALAGLLCIRAANKRDLW
jgi:hypothetical protein